MREKVTVIKCDDCGDLIPDGTGASLRLNYVERQKGRTVADLCNTCAAKIPGTHQKAHGRKSAAELAAA